VSLLRRFFRDPLAHFLLVGGLLFAVFGLFGNGMTAGPNRVVISPGQVQRAIQVFTGTHLRAPTDDELQGLIDQEIEAEIYYREGIAMGLDREDEIIRRRLKQKLLFLTQDIADQAQPTDADLQAFMNAHASDYGGEIKVAFSQIFLNPDHDGEQPADRAKLLLAKVSAGDGRLDYARVSDALPLPNDFEATPLHDVARVFGGGFADSLLSLPVGHWAGPVTSGYGQHLVVVRELVAATPPRLADIRETVLRDWQNARRVEANAEAYRQMRAKYSVKVELPSTTGGVHP